MSDVVVIRNDNPTVVQMAGAQGPRGYSGPDLTDLAAPDGAALVGYGDETVADKLKDIITPDDHGAAGAGDVTTEVQAAMDAALARGVPLLLRRRYAIGGELRAGIGLTIIGIAGAGFDRIDQVRTTTTANITSGGTSKTVAVTSTTGFAVGQTVMFAWTSGSRTGFPSNGYNHRNPVITAIGAGTLTVELPADALAGMTFPAIPSGAHVQTAGRLLIGLGGNLFEGFTVDDNGTNQTEAWWLAMNAITVEGSNCTCRDLVINDSFSDSVLVGGPSGGEITAFRWFGGEIEGAGASGIHFGNVSDILIDGLTGDGANLRNTGLNDAHQTGNQGGMVIFSDNCRDMTVQGGKLKNAMAGVGSIDGSTAIYNDLVKVVGVTIVDCLRAVDIKSVAKRVVIVGNQIRSSYNPATSLFASERWDNSVIYVAGTNAAEQTSEVTIAGNQLINTRVYLSWCYGAKVHDNLLHLYEMQAVAATLGGLETAGIFVGQSSACSINGNTILGGRDGISFVQNAAGSDVHRLSQCHDNLLIDQRFAPIRGAFAAPSAECRVQVNGNVIENSTATTYPTFTGTGTAATSDGAALSSAAGYAAIVREAGMFGTGNRIQLATGATYAGAGAAGNWDRNVIAGAWA